MWKQILGVTMRGWLKEEWDNLVIKPKWKIPSCQNGSPGKY